MKYQGQKAVRACMIKRLNLEPVKHSELWELLGQRGNL